jgi:hypothetical protein
MPNYSVEGADGQMYGPVDENGLVAWAREGRLAANTRIRIDETGGIMMAAEVPALAVVFGRVQQPQYPPAPAAYAQPMQPQYAASAVPTGAAHIPQSAYGQPAAPVGTAAYPHQVQYATPYAQGAYGPSGAHRFRQFPVAVVVLLHIFTFGIFSYFYWSLMHSKLPKNRSNDPSGAKAFWFYWIPFFNLYWWFFCPLRLIDRIDEQRAMRGLGPAGIRGLVIAAVIINLVGIFVPLVGLLTIVLWPIAWGVLQSKINELVYVGGLGALPAPGGQYPGQLPMQAAAAAYR